MSTLNGIIHQKKCILPHPSDGNAQSDTAVRNIGCDAKSPEFIFRTFEIGVSHRDVYQGVLCL